MSVGPVHRQCGLADPAGRTDRQETWGISLAALVYRAHAIGLRSWWLDCGLVDVCGRPRGGWGP
jgi:hypothetical protein